MPPDDLPELPILNTTEGTLSTDEMCRALGGITRDTLRNRWYRGDLTPAGRLPGKGSRGDLRWHPPKDDDANG